MGSRAWFLSRISSVLMLAGAVAGCGGDDAPAADAGGTDSGRTVCADDSECSDGAFCTGEEICNPDSPAANAFGCLPGAAPCLASQTCDEGGDRCVSDCGTAPDADGDGHASTDCGGDDCDDADANRYPGNTEVCDDDAHDEDCDSGTFGDRDEDGDGEVDATCCNVNSLGDRTCGRDCDDTNAGVNPTTSEVCDGVDNDCDGSTDEGFECTPGTTRPCTVCSRTGEGTQTCDPSVCAWSPCTAPEACNACDDDNDSTIDEDFLCVRGASTACTNACGTELVGTCSATCDGVESCVSASEVCNYCDDDGDGTHDDELSLASASSRAVFNCMGSASLPSGLDSVEVTLTDATCEVTPSSNQRLAELLDTGSRADSGAMSHTVPMGFGRLTTKVLTRWTSSSTSGSSGGWAVVFIASGRLRLSALTGVGYDRAEVTRGFAVEWRWNGNFPDSVTVVRLNGTSTGEIMPSGGTDGVAPNSSWQYAGEETQLQPLWISYLPDVAGRAGSGTALRVSHFDSLCGTCDMTTSNVLRTYHTSSLMGELAPGDDLTIAVVAGESSSVTTGGVQIGYEGVATPLSWVAQDQLCALWP